MALCFLSCLSSLQQPLLLLSTQAYCSLCCHLALAPTNHFCPQFSSAAYQWSCWNPRSNKCPSVIARAQSQFPFLCLWHHLSVSSDLPHSRPVCFTFSTMSHPSPIQLPGWNLDALRIAVGLDRDEFFHREVVFASMSSEDSTIPRSRPTSLPN